MKKTVKKSTTKKVVEKKPTKKSKVSPSAPEDQADSRGSSTKKKKKGKVARPKEVVKALSDAIDDDLTPYCNPDDPEVVYSKVDILPFFSKRYNPKALGPLTGERAQELLGWTEEVGQITFGSDFLFKDRNGKKIRCLNNLHNRPFDNKLAEAWMLEVLRRKWRMNGETMIIDCKGMTQDAQHRLIGLVWAVQEWHRNPGKWAEYWSTEPTMDTIIIVGIPDDDETVNTINTGKRRSLADAIFRSGYFDDIPYKKRKVVAKIAESCVKRFWERTGQKQLSRAPHMPHSEAIELVDNHPGLLRSILHIYEEDGTTNLIGGYVKQGLAAACLYLMGSGKSDRESYISQRSEDSLDFTYWDKACEFWSLVAKKSNRLEPMLDALIAFPEDVSGPYIRSMSSALVAKSWDLFIRGKKITSALIEVQQVTNDDGRLSVAECPLFGGIDVGTDSPDEDEEELDDA